MTKRIEIHIPNDATEYQRERVNSLYDDVVTKNPKSLVFLYEGIYPEFRSVGLEDKLKNRLAFIFNPTNSKKVLGDVQDEINQLESENIRLRDEIDSLEEQIEENDEKIEELESLKEELTNERN